MIHVIDSANKFPGPLERAREIQKLLNVKIVACKVEKGFEFGLDQNESTLGVLRRTDLSIFKKLAKEIKSSNADIVNTHHHNSGLVIRLLKLFGMVDQKIVHSFGNEFMK